MANSTATPSSKGLETRLEDIFRYLLGQTIPRGMPAWPPDVFLVCATILNQTGLYIRLVDRPAVSNPPLFSHEEQEELVRAGRNWRDLIEEKIRFDKLSGPQPEKIKRIKPPKALTKLWAELVKNRESSIEKLDLKPRDKLQRDLHAEHITRALLGLTIAADEACAGIGLDSKMGKSTGDVDETREESFLLLAQAVLESKNRKTLTSEIPASRGKVLPKQHTPQCGLSLRSLTHHLAYLRPGDCDVRWTSFQLRQPTVEGQFNLLLLPWPEKIETTSFRVQADHQPFATAFSMFEYGPVDTGSGVHPNSATSEESRRDSLCQKVEKAMAFAHTCCNDIHAVVFPELALSYDEYLKVEQSCIENRCALIAGVRHKVNDKETNSCISQFLGLWQHDLDLNRQEIEVILEDLARANKPDDWENEVGRLKNNLKNLLVENTRKIVPKHHRWCLDRNQILQYQLGGMLSTHQKLWEATEIEHRRLEVFSLDRWLTCTMLICEDLARQDPVAEYVRAIGPNLVIALLMDGPQIRQRWPARYASVLADDPGCSVLTLTSLGMSTRSRPMDGAPDRSRVIGLWRDIHYGDQELELNGKDNAGVLTLARQNSVEYSLDGRDGGRGAFTPVFSGFHGFNV